MPLGKERILCHILGHFSDVEPDVDFGTTLSWPLLSHLSDLGLILPPLSMLCMRILAQQARVRSSTGTFSMGSATDGACSCLCPIRFVNRSAHYIALTIPTPPFTLNSLLTSCDEPGVPIAAVDSNEFGLRFAVEKCGYWLRTPFSATLTLTSRKFMGLFLN